jgi:type IV secretory pathway TraG/TraD family ATPase VirD4
MPKVKHILGALTFACAGLTWLYHWQAFERSPPVYVVEGQPYYLHPGSLATCTKAGAFSLLWAPGAREEYQSCEDWFRQNGVWDDVLQRWQVLGGGAALTLILAAGFALAIRFEPPPPKIVRGPRRFTGQKARSAIGRISRREARQTGGGITFPPGIAMSRDRESRHMLITGAVGSGKTQTIQHLILEAMQFGDKMLVLDTKGDMTERLPGKITLIAPQDARSAIWDIAADCTTKQDARELAARFIPKSSDPMWAEGARELLVACIVSLQIERPGKWTWSDLHARAILAPAELIVLANTCHPAAAQILGDAANRTAMSILTTFKAHIHVLEAMADAWAAGASGTFSIASWLGAANAPAPVILQRDGRYPQLTNAWIGGLVSLLSAHVCSPAFRESSTRRIWLFLDEFPQLEAMDDLASLLDLGRSKGVCVVLAAQDTSQIRINYGRDRTSAWLSMIGTHVIGRMNPGEGAEDMSRAIGMQEIERVSRTENVSGGKRSVSRTPQRSVRPVVTPSELSSRLGRKGNKVRILVMGFGEDVFEVDLPIVSLPKQREANVPAPWTQASPLAPLRQKLPPPIDPESPAEIPRTRLLTPDDLVRIRKPKPDSSDV